MLKKGLRLKTKNDFERVFRRGNPLFFGAIACKIAKNTLTHTRVGFSLSKKHINRAVDRNRLRRALSEALSPHILSRPEKPLDIAFFTVKKMNVDKHNKAFASAAKSVVEYISSS